MCKLWNLDNDGDLMAQVSYRHHGRRLEQTRQDEDGRMRHHQASGCRDYFAATRRA